MYAKPLLGCMLFLAGTLVVSFLNICCGEQHTALVPLSFLPGPQLPAAFLVSGKGIDINRADTPALELLPGIGPTLALRIVADRERHGSFASCRDLRRVHGIGEKILQRVCSSLAGFGGERPQP